MKIVGLYSFNNGQKYIEHKFGKELIELKSAIESIDAEICKTKKSREKTMKGKILYSPVALNHEFKNKLLPLGWKNIKVACDYPTKFYLNNYKPQKVAKRDPFRDMDFVKNKLGCEVQFGKYSFMVYNVCAKMTIFRNLKYIETGVEIVPIKELASHMSSGVSYFEQFVWDLQARGISNLDIPVLIIGINA